MPNLERLEELEFTPEVIADFSELEDLVTPQHLELAREKAERLTQSYVMSQVIKKGGPLLPFEREMVLEKFWTWAYLDTYVNAALDRFGIRGKARRTYRRIAHEAVRILRRGSVRIVVDVWPRFLYGLYGKWVNLSDLDPKVIKIMLMIAAKVYYQIYRGKLRPPEKFTEKISLREYHPSMKGV